MHKEKSKAIFRAAGVPVAESMLCRSKTPAASHPMPPPYVVKPVAEGSSVGVHIVLDGSNGPAKMILDERAILATTPWSNASCPGKELTCAVMGDVALGVIDIVSKARASTTINAKYAPGGSQHILPAEIPHDVYRKVPAICARRPTRRWAAAA